MTESEWWVYCVELDARKGTLQKIEKRSPVWQRRLPQIFVNTGTTDPRVLFANGFGKAQQEDVAAYGLSLREDILLDSGLTKEESLRARSRETERLRDAGYGVLNSKPRKTHRVYVIDLDPAVRDELRVKRENPDADPAMPCVYVGQTGKSLKKRRAEHRKGIKAGRGYVTKYGFGRPFLRNLFEHLNPCLHEDSLQHERELAESLRAQGYTVTGGH